MDHVRVEIEPDTEDTYAGTSIARSTKFIAVPIPIEAKLRSLSVRLLFEVCRVQPLSVHDLSKHSNFEFPTQLILSMLEIFDDAFIDYLFDLVEQTRQLHDDTFNYSVIKLIVSLANFSLVVSFSHDPYS